MKTSILTKTSTHATLAFSALCTLTLLFFSCSNTKLKREIEGDWKFEKAIQGGELKTDIYQNYLLVFKDKSFQLTNINSTNEKPYFPTSGEYDFTNFGKSIVFTYTEQYAPSIFTNGGESEEQIVMDIKEYANNKLELDEQGGGRWFKLTR